MIIQVTNFLSCVRSDNSKDELQSKVTLINDSLVCQVSVDDKTCVCTCAYSSNIDKITEARGKTSDMTEM